MIIAIDGLTASGKGTLAQMLSEHLGLPHLDTGLLYRATALAALRQNIALSDGPACARLASDLVFDLQEQDLRSNQTGAAASEVSAHEPVRAALLQLQRDFAYQSGGAILDGRDIGTVVCPDANIKFWVHAALASRAERRHAELLPTGKAPNLVQLQASLQDRDQADARRAHAPAQKASDAISIDSTHLDKAQMLKIALQIIADKSNT